MIGIVVGKAIELVDIILINGLNRLINSRTVKLHGKLHLIGLYGSKAIGIAILCSFSDRILNGLIIRSIAGKCLGDGLVHDRINNFVAAAQA
jgi:hypothetical protein